MNRRNIVNLASAAAGLALLLWAGATNYLFFHAAVEGFSVVVAALVYVLALTTYKYSGDDLLLFIGQAHVVIGALDFLHLLSYRGVSLLANSSANTSAQLWIVGRYLWAAMFIMTPAFIKRRLPHGAVMAAFAVVAAVLVWAIIARGAFPICFTDNAGLTHFKLVSEYAVIATVVTGALLLRQRRTEIDSHLYKVLLGAAAATIFSELCFTAYSSPFGIVNVIGHIAKVAAYNLLLHGIVMRGLQAPYDSIFAELQRSAVCDPLTGLNNRFGFGHAAEMEMAAAARRGSTVGALMIDLDKFKGVNDSFGHQAGDSVLRQFAHILLSSVKSTDTVARLGGDEFVVLLPGVDLDSALAVADRIRRDTQAWAHASDIAAGLDVSIGAAIWKPHMRADVDTLLRDADDAMYAEKESKGGRDMLR